MPDELSTMVIVGRSAGRMGAKKFGTSPSAMHPRKLDATAIAKEPAVFEPDEKVNISPIKKILSPILDSWLLIPETPKFTLESKTLQNPADFIPRGKFKKSK
ncbi:MAG: hypothetical protein LBT86_02745 [Deltaproteobacteria bacterium]|nr:hypothetical protein [Deltaproteobacteria bacterium]